MFLWIVILVISMLVVVAVVFVYNGLIKKQQMVENGWSDVDVQLKRRSELIPRLVEVVKGFAKHEKSLFEEVTAKRAAAIDAGDNSSKRLEAESALSLPVGRLMAVAEDYPDLKSDQNFLELQTELTDTEDKIEMSRRYLNGTVREMNIAAGTFPANLVAKLFGFHQQDYFEIDLADRANPEVDLGDQQ